MKTKIYSIPPGTEFWSIALQESLSSQNELYVKVTNHCGDNPYFGKLQLVFQNLALQQYCGKDAIGYTDKANGEISIDFAKCTLVKEFDGVENSEAAGIIKKDIKKKIKLAVYPGSFDPFHIGHLDIFLKAEEIFDEVVVAIGKNPEKEKCEKINRLETIKLQLPGRKVEEFDGFLVDYIYKKQDEGYDVTVVKGLRNCADFDYEINQLRIMKDQCPSIKMIFIPCESRLAHISSTAVRLMEKIQEGSASEYIVKPEMLIKHIPLTERYSSKINYADDEIVVTISLEDSKAKKSVSGETTLRQINDIDDTMFPNKTNSVFEMIFALEVELNKLTKKP